MNSKQTTPKRQWWGVLVTGSALGLIASFIQTIERINFAKNPTASLQCDLNAIFSCSNVFDAWQSSVFGFSNSILCVAFFAVLLGAGLAGLTGSNLQRQLRLVLHFFTVFFLGFGAWYLWQSTYYIGYICIFCLACYTGVILINWAWLRINASDIFRSPSAYARWQGLSKAGADTFGWLVWALLIAFMIINKFA